MAQKQYSKQEIENAEQGCGHLLAIAIGLIVLALVSAFIVWLGNQGVIGSLVATVIVMVLLATSWQNR